MYNFDASAMIDLWDNYPIQSPHFDPIWKWFSKQVENKNFVISDVAIQEVRQKILYDEIKKLLPKSIGFINILDEIIVLKKTSDDLIFAQTIKTLLEIEEDNYQVKGVGENDLLIIASAKRNNSILVTNEERQGDATKIKIKAKFKIPAVCNLGEVNIKNINLAELLHLDSLW